MMKNKKMLIIALVVILVAVAALVGTLIWRFGGETPNPTDPTGPSGPGITNTDPSSVNPTEPSSTIAVDTWPTDMDEPTGPNVLATDPDASVPVSTEPVIDPSVPVESQPTEPVIGTDPMETAPATDPDVFWTEVNETVYALETVRLYEEADEQSKLIGKIKEGDSIQRVAVSDHGWSRLIYKGQEVYANSTLLVTEKPTEPTEQPTDPGETLPDEDDCITMYVQAQTTGRTGPGEDYKTVHIYRKGDVVHVVPDSEKNGWVKILHEKSFCYVKEKHLGMEDPNAATKPTEDPDDPWSRYVQDADPETGISWDGVSPIIYIYEDGSTGTERRHGAKYELRPGRYAIWLDPEQMHGDDGVDPCTDCGKPKGDGTGGTCGRYMKDVICPNCGEEVKAHTCHYCDGD